MPYRVAAPPPPSDDADDAVEPRAEDLTGEREIWPPLSEPAPKPTLKEALIGLLTGTALGTIALLVIYR